MGSSVALPLFAASSILGTANTFINASQNEKFAKAEAEAARRRTLFETESEQRQRRDRLKRLRAAARASAASRGTAGAGGSSGAILDGLGIQAAAEDRAARHRQALGLNDIERRRQSNLLELADRKRRAAIGFIGDGGTFADRVGPLE